MESELGPYREQPIGQITVPRPSDRMPFDPQHMTKRDIASLALFFAWILLLSTLAVAFPRSGGLATPLLVIAAVPIPMIAASVLRAARSRGKLVLQRVGSHVVGLKGHDVPAAGTIRITRRYGYRGQDYLRVSLCDDGMERRAVSTGDDGELLIGIFPMTRRADAEQFAAGLASLGRYRISSTFDRLVGVERRIANEGHPVGKGSANSLDRE